MLIDHQILTWSKNVGLTSDYKEVVKLPKTDFPKLIFQDFMNQLKLPKLKIGFIENTSNLLENIPEDLEQVDESIKWQNDFKYALNLEDILTYYLLTQLLKTDFELTGIFSNHGLKTEYSFVSKIPFSNIEGGCKVSQFILLVVKYLGFENVKLVQERFFILLGENYKDKLMLFLTYLDTKYKFKTDKKAFVNATLGEENLSRVKDIINSLKLKYA